MIRIEFLGAMACVGASGVLIDTGREKLVLDYGTKVREIPPKFPIEVKGSIDAILLSHSHLDHCGGLPTFFSRGNDIPIYSIDVTRPLTELLLKDSIKISREEGVELPFNEKDVKRTIKHFKNVEFRKKFKIHNASVTFYDAGHIPGSAQIYLNLQEKTVLYTGDLNTLNTRLMKKADTKLPPVDILITESTYSDRDHLNRKEQEKAFVDMIDETISKNGVALVASFAVGRAQEIMILLDKYKIGYPIYLDGMAKKATNIINSYPSRIKDLKSLDKALKNVEYVKGSKTRKKIIKEPSVIVTTSGMLNGGPIIWYIKKLHKDPRSSLILTGWQVEGTPGRILLETGRYINEDEGLNLDIKMKVRRFDFSAHLGRSQLFEYIEKVSPEKIFCIHGDHTEEFAAELKERGFNAVAPIANNRIFEV